MTEGYSVPFSLAWVMVFLLKGRKPHFIVIVIERKEATGKELLRLHDKVFSRVPEIQSVVTS